MRRTRIRAGVPNIGARGMNVADMGDAATRRVPWLDARVTMRTATCWLRPTALPRRPSRLAKMRRATRTATTHPIRVAAGVVDVVMPVAIQTAMAVIMARANVVTVLIKVASHAPVNRVPLRRGSAAINVAGSAMGAGTAAAAGTVEAVDAVSAAASHAERAPAAAVVEAGPAEVRPAASRG